jgi:hypothetical protein
LLDEFVKYREKYGIALTLARLTVLDSAEVPSAPESQSKF